MKVALPLSAKVALWLLLNIAVLVAAAVTFVGTTYGLGWEAVLSSGAGDNVRNIGATVAGELRVNPRQSIDDLLARIRPAGGTDLYLFLNTGIQIGGSPVSLPPAVTGELTKGPPPNRPPGPPGVRDERFPDEPRPPPPRDRPAAGQPRPDGVVGFMRHAGEPLAYWVGIRLPVARGDGHPSERGSLVLRIPSTFALIKLLNFGPWLIAAAAAFVISVLCWLPFVGNLRHGIVAVNSATEKIAQGRLDTRISTRRRDELGALSHGVNRMAEQLEAQVQGQKRFLGDVAHELGSPLARLQVAVELLQRDAAENQQMQIADVRDEVEQITSLVNELLAFTKAGLRSRDAALSAVELAPLIANITERDDPANRIVVDIPPALAVRADPLLLHRALSNLIRNALRYAADARTTVSAIAVGNTVTIIVADDGPGVPADALARLGEPFFRPDTARSRETGGTGLGLAIVKSSVEACRGRVIFSSRAPHGFSTEITLDRAS